MRLPAAAALLLGASLAAAQSGVKSDWERERETRDLSELEVVLPAPPKGALIEFFVSSASSFKFFIDPQSLSPGADGVVRYTLVARSLTGAENVSYEGIRCEGGAYKVYALGNGGRWVATQQPEWRRIEGRSVQRWHNELYLRYFCPYGEIIRNAEEGLNALRRGGHPAVTNAERAN